MTLRYNTRWGCGEVEEPGRAQAVWFPARAPCHVGPCALRGPQPVAYGLDPIVCGSSSASSPNSSAAPPPGLLGTAVAQHLVSVCASALHIPGCWVCLESPPTPIWLGKCFTFCPMLTSCPASPHVLSPPPHAHTQLTGPQPQSAGSRPCGPRATGLPPSLPRGPLTPQKGSGRRWWLRVKAYPYSHPGSLRSSHRCRLQASCHIPECCASSGRSRPSFPRCPQQVVVVALATPGSMLGGIVSTPVTWRRSRLSEVQLWALGPSYLAELLGSSNLGTGLGPRQQRWLPLT